MWNRWKMVRRKGRNYKWVWPDATVTEVIDGDTFMARVVKEERLGPIDIGFHGEATVDLKVPFEQKLRLNRTNAPKLATKRGQAAAEAFRSLTQGPVTIETIKPYKYGDEFIAEVTLADGRNLTDVLVSEGLAVYWDGVGERPNDE